MIRQYVLSNVGRIFGLKQMGRTRKVDTKIGRPTILCWWFMFIAVAYG
jgi:hypothetical protein